MTGPSELSWLVNSPQFFVSMSIVAVCDEGLSLTVWATVFRVNGKKEEEARASFAGT